MEKKQLHLGLLSEYRTEIMGIACIWVLIHHNFCDWPTVLKPLKTFCLYGNIGVDIFLFLSGIGLFYALNKKVSLVRFYLKRFVRIIVPYLIICVPYYLWKNISVGIGSFVLDITQLSFPVAGMITTWYIPAILMFYLSYPLIHKLLNNNKGDRSIIFILCVLAYVVLLLMIKQLFPVFYNNTEIALTRFIIFFVGCYAGKYVKDKYELEFKHICTCGAFVVLYVIFRETNSLVAFWIRMSYALLTVALCIVFSFLLSLLKNHNSFVVKIFRYFGERSLEIYLVHIVLRNVWAKLFGIGYVDKWAVVDYLIVVILSLIISSFLHVLVRKVNTLIVKGRYQ